MWIGPVLVGLGAAAALTASPPAAPLVLAGYVVMGLAGAGVGYLRARHMDLAVDPGSGHIMGKATPMGAAILVVLLLARFGFKSLFPTAGATPGRLGADVVHASDALLLFSFSMMAVQFAILLQRSRPLLAARADRQDSVPVPRDG